MFTSKAANLKASDELRNFRPGPPAPPAKSPAADLGGLVRALLPQHIHIASTVAICNLMKFEFQAFRTVPYTSVRSALSDLPSARPNHNIL